MNMKRNEVQLASAIDSLIEQRIKQNEGSWRQTDGEPDPFRELVRLLRSESPND